VRAGVILPGGTAREQLEQAVLAEQSGWDGVFVWEAAYGIDAWTLLGGMAARTEGIRLGTLLTPLPWRRPWKVASQVATLDQLSNGRAILTVGLGAVMGDLPRTGEEEDLRRRADLLDEGIEVIRGLLAGGGTHVGANYRVEPGADDQMQVARPVQDPVPIWVVGVWPRPKSMRRVLACDGVVPQYGGEGSPEDVRAMREWLAEHGARPDIDVIAEGETPHDPAAASVIVRPWADAGCTWWLETEWELPHHVPERMRQIRERIAAGPPAL
jgi:alkanesulfonate monooxygenase SsuD/methylene tetrahydromethanopterin reductase-like flavin-dependent oxidoreductase (luciferase family)